MRKGSKSDLVVAEGEGMFEVLPSLEVGPTEAGEGIEVMGRGARVLKISFVGVSKSGSGLASTRSVFHNACRIN